MKGLTQFTEGMNASFIKLCYWFRFNKSKSKTIFKLHLTHLTQEEVKGTSRTFNQVQKCSFKTALSTFISVSWYNLNKLLLVQGLFSSIFFGTLTFSKVMWNFFWPVWPFSLFTRFWSFFEALSRKKNFDRESSERNLKTFSDLLTW